MGALLLLDGHARNAARLTADLRAADEGTGMAPSYTEVMTPLLDPARFPALRRVLDTGAIDSRATTTRESGLELGLQRLLDGIGVLIEGAQRQAAD